MAAKRSARDGSERNGVAPGNQVLRCAIYTRKSTDEGLDQDFNTLDAQRESGESYINSQKHEGWTALPARYDDGGFTGANMERPALKRLLADIANGLVNCVVVYKVDRLTRSLLDFSRIMEVLDNHGATFVSVTQSFNSTSSLGRLTLNILLSFAQFEREMISERTRDKMSAARRKGKWIGGSLVLGYDCVPGGGSLSVNPQEADQVREIYRLYLEHGSLIPVIRELDQRCWTTKAWITREGRKVGGKPFTKNKLHNLLTNVIYTGKVNFEGTIYQGEQERIVDDETWNAVQQRLNRNSNHGGRNIRNKYGALLKGLVRCGSCDVGMTHTYVRKGASKLYRYYVCINAHQRGWNNCETRSVSAPSLEEAVVRQLRSVAQSPQMVSELVTRAQRRSREMAQEIGNQRAHLAAALIEVNQQIAHVLGATGAEGLGSEQGMKHLSELNEQASRISSELVTMQENADPQWGDPAALQDLLERFDPLWEHMSSWEQESFVRALVEEVRYDGRNGAVTVAFRSHCIKALCNAEPLRQEKTA